MARMKNIVHSQDACTMIFEGNKSTPEPSSGIIKFPGGSVEVTRCTDQTYWVHISINENATPCDSRIDFNHDAYKRHGIIDVPDAENIQHLAIRVIDKK